VNGRPEGAVKLAAVVLDRRADGNKLGEVLAPLVAPDIQAHPDNPVGAKLIRSSSMRVHRQLACVVHRLGEHGHLLVLAVAGLLEADVVDARADHQAQRSKSGLAHQQEFVDRQVAS